MKVIPFVHEGLGNSSYLVQLTQDSAVLVDPDRSVRRYLRETEKLGLRIVGVLETHLHADFVTGSRELLEQIDIEPYAARAGNIQFPHHATGPGDSLTVEGIRVRVIGTPGHTPEHVSYVFQTPRAEPPILFSGGSLIVGGAARTDLVSPDLTVELTRAQYYTLKDAFADLPDDTLLYPTHGGGSFCSTGSAGERTSTLGKERQANPLLRFDDEDEFVRWFPTTFPAVPDYFFRMRGFNQRGPRLRREINSPEPLSAERFDRLRGKALVVDVRSIEAYAAGHIPGALNVTFRAAYATWLGWLVPEGTPLLFVLGDMDLEAVVDESMLVGYEDFAGYLDGDIEAWRNAGFEIVRTELVAPDVAHEVLRGGAVALDVREPAEFANGHVDKALHIPLGELRKRLSELPSGQPILVYCGHGERASTAASILERAGHRRLWNLAGGMQEWSRYEQRV